MAAGHGFGAVGLGDLEVEIGVRVDDDVAGDGVDGGGGVEEAVVADDDGAGGFAVFLGTGADGVAEA